MISLTYLTIYVDPETLNDCREWYTAHLALNVVWESEQFVMFQGDQGAQLGLHAGKPLSQADQVQIHFEVDDVDERYTALQEKGLDIVQSPRDTPWGYRVIVLKDPAGHTVELYHKL